MLGHTKILAQTCGTIFTLIIRIIIILQPANPAIIGPCRDLFIYSKVGTQSGQCCKAGRLTLNFIH